MAWGNWLWGHKLAGGSVTALQKLPDELHFQSQFSIAVPLSKIDGLRAQTVG